MPVTNLIDRASGRPWPWVFRGERQFQPSSAVFVTDDMQAEIDVACAGLGFSQSTEYLVRPHIESGRLVRLLRRMARYYDGLASRAAYAIATQHGKRIERLICCRYPRYCHYPSP